MEKNGAIVNGPVRVVRCEQLEKETPEDLLDSFRVLENRINLEAKSFFSLFSSKLQCL